MDSYKASIDTITPTLALILSHNYAIHIAVQTLIQKLKVNIKQVVVSSLRLSVLRLENSLEPTQLVPLPSSPHRYRTLLLNRQCKQFQTLYIVLFLLFLYDLPVLGVNRSHFIPPSPRGISPIQVKGVRTNTSSEGRTQTGSCTVYTYTPTGQPLKI